MASSSRRIVGLAVLAAALVAAGKACSRSQEELATVAPAKVPALPAERPEPTVLTAPPEEAVEKPVAPRPWQPPAAPELEGLDGAAQRLIQGDTAGALSKLQSVPEAKRGSAEWFRTAAVTGRAQRLGGQFSAAVETLNAAVKHPHRCRYFACELLYDELAQARVDWVDSDTIDDVKARDKLLRAAALDWRRATKLDPNRRVAPMRVSRALALANVQGTTAKSTRSAAATALRALDSVIDDYPNHPNIAQLELEHARALSRLGQVTKAASRFRELAIAYTGAPQADTAWQELNALAEQHRRIRARDFSTKEQLERAAAARRARWVDTSRELLDQLLANESAPAYVKHNARLSRAYTAYKQRDYSRCADDFGALYKSSGAIKMRDEYSRCLDRAARYDEAIDLWTKTARKRKASKGAKATGLWTALNIAFRGGDYEKTQALLKEYERSFRSHRSRRHWLHAWLPYRLGDLDKAEREFEELERFRDYRTMARYFRGRILVTSEDVERLDQGEALLRGVMQAEPLSYYGVVARQRLLDAGIDPGPLPAVEPMSDDGRVLGYAETRAITSALAEDFRHFSSAVRRLDQLWSAGWLEEARREYRVVADTYQNGMAAISKQRRWIPRNEDLVEGLGWRAEWPSSPAPKPGRKGRAMLRDRAQSTELGHQLRELAIAMSDPHRYAKLTPSDAYPFRSRWFVRAYREVIEREAARREVDPFALWSLMYTESRFRRHVVSPVGARGALQIMPWTGRQLTQRLGGPHETFDPDVLFDIETNAYLASYYVDQLIEKFHGQAPLAYASYNGGPSNVARWVEAKARMAGELALDDFIEEIPFRETQRYTKRVIEVQAAYTLMYTGKWARISNEVDLNVGTNIDF
ncbi:MAG: lytic transglycosylase domain-containing protein [Myxococcales bacterium FL481]|nr:MAG: lytic transglycosylase domain-containing protein [Myxococcales bacterium FL481]